MFKTVFISIISLFIFSGCISLTKELPSYTTYTLALDSNSLKESKQIDKSILIMEPKAIASINTRAINYSKKSFVQEKYALSKWSDKPSKMIQKSIANYLTNKNAYKFISTSNIKVKSDYRLESQLVDFKHSFSKNSSYAKFSIRVYLINNKTKKLSFKNFTYEEETNTNDAKGVVIAFNTINSLFLSDLDKFIVEFLNNK